MRLLVTASIVLFACSPPEPAPEQIRRTRWQDMIVESRPLPADTTFSAVGLRIRGERDDGATEWSWDFRDSRGPVRDEFVQRDFRLTIANRGPIAREFHARIDYFDPEGESVRRKELERLLVPPFTESAWIGATMIRAPGKAEVLARVLPVSEPFDPVTEQSRR